MRMPPTDFGTLRRTTPISTAFGFDRGRPIDRHYIERFLARHQAAIRGSVVEIGDDRYTTQFGGAAVTRREVLDVLPSNAKATIIADLERPEQQPAGEFDCVLCTQALQYLYDVRAGVRSLHRLLKPGGTLLATFPGVSRTNDLDYGDRWYWNLTSRSARRLFAEEFSPSSVAVEGHGNVLVCAASLYGLADWELGDEELEAYDPGFEVVITVSATRA